jgi:hypothetical protein
MSKICGLFGTTNNTRVIQEHVQSMTSVMQHDPRSCDEYAWFDHGGIGVIKNLPSDSHTIAWDNERASCLAACGHIAGATAGQLSLSYNDIDLSTVNSDTFLLHAFKTHGSEILPDLNGTFAFAYYNSATCSIAIVNDRYGFMPLYYYYDQNMFLFASEVKAIVQVLGQPEFDWESYADFFYIGHMTEQKTLFKKIHALDSGHMLTYSNGSLHESRYYDFTQTPVLGEKDVSTEKIASLFVEAVARKVKQEQPHTVLLSGGYDSRLVLGALHRSGITPKIVSLEHASETQGADGKFAALIANSLGLACDYRPSRKHFFASSDALEVFYILDGMVPTWDLFIGEIYPELDRRLGRVWDGLALDVALGGSHQIAGGIFKNLKEFIKKRRRNRLLLRLILTPQQFRAVDSSFMRRLHSGVAKIPVSENQFLYYLLKNRTRRRIAVNPYQLFAAKVEAMTPATDMYFMDYVLGIPSHLKLNHRLYIDMLKKNFPTLTKVPIVSGGTFFYFDRRNSVNKLTKTKMLLRRILEPVLKFAKPFVKQILKIFMPRYRSVTNKQVYARLIVGVLEIKHFDRPFYNKTLLRQLFTMYRSGNLIFHKMFVIIFYIELWHLLFIDKDSPILFNPRNLELAVDED